MLEAVAGRRIQNVNLFLQENPEIKHVTKLMNHRVLIVDDEPFNLIAFENLLKTFFDYEIELASSAK